MEEKRCFPYLKEKQKQCFIYDIGVSCYNQMLSARGNFILKKAIYTRILCICNWQLIRMDSDDIFMSSNPVNINLCICENQLYEHCLYWAVPLKISPPPPEDFGILSLPQGGVNFQMHIPSVQFFDKVYHRGSKYFIKKCQMSLSTWNSHLLCIIFFLNLPQGGCGVQMEQPFTPKRRDNIFVSVAMYTYHDQALVTILLAYPCSNEQ